MSIQRIDKGSTRGLQVRVFRNCKVITRFLAFQKHGGEEKTYSLATQVEQELEGIAGPRTPSRRKGFHMARPNSNTSTGIVGIGAFHSSTTGRRPALQFVAQWRQGPPGARTYGRIQRSADEYGVLGALALVLNARAEATGKNMPTPADAWAIIQKHKGWLPSGQSTTEDPMMLYKFQEADEARALRKILGLNQSQFWEPLGVTQSAGSRYENERKLPRPIIILINLRYGRTPIKTLAEFRDTDVEILLKGR